MKELVNLKNWKRTKTYEIFSKFSDPYTGIVTKLNVSNLVNYTKNHEISFYATMSYLVLKSLDAIEEFKYGYGKNNDKIDIYRYNSLAITVTTLDNCKNLNFTRYIIFSPNIDKFISDFETAKIDAEKGIEPINGLEMKDVAKVYVTCLPWIRFSNFKDAINSSEISSEPKICWGQYYVEDGEYKLDFSLLVNHAFQDGYQMSQFISYFQLYEKEFEVLNFNEIQSKYRKLLK